MKVGELLAGIDALLEPSRYRDYCPNGLQVEGAPEVRLLVTGVTASLALIEAAIDAGADAILVHHGLFWRGDDMRVVGPRRERLARLLAARVNLLAYHLPLDAHPELGNNARLGALLGLVADRRFGEQDIGFSGMLPAAMPARAFAGRVREALGRDCLLVGDADRPVRRIGWCSGGAQGYLADAIADGCDLFLSGEISEQTTHLARESGVAFIAAGHHATERYGAQALGHCLSERFGIGHRHIDIDNPA